MKTILLYRKKKYGILCISFSKRLISKIFRAVECIKKIDKRFFDQVCRYLPKIVIVKGGGHYNAYIIEESTWFAMSGGIQEDHVLYLASLLVHESQHMLQAKNKKKYFGQRAEKEAYLKQREFLRKIPNKQLSGWFVAWLDKQFQAKWWLKLDGEAKNHDPFEKVLQDLKSGKLAIISC